MKNFIMFGAFLMAFCASAQASQPQYTLTDLGDIGPDGNVTGINDRDQIVGSDSVGTGDSEGFIIDANTKTTTVLNPFTDVFPLSINNSGIVSGYDCAIAFCAPGDSQAFIFNGTFNNIPQLSGIESEASQVNDSGIVVGNSAKGGFVYNINSSSISFGIAGLPAGINNHGTIVGRAAFPPGTVQGYVLANGTLTDINGPNTDQSLLGRINDNNVAVGEDNQRAIYYDGQIHFLGPDETFSQANAINNFDQIVGVYGDNSGAFAFLYENGQMYNLNDLVDHLPPGADLLYANGINNEGDIVGAYSMDDQEHGYLLSPVPEPSSVYLMLVGLGAFLFFKRKSLLPQI